MRGARSLLCRGALVIGSLGVLAGTPARAAADSFAEVQLLGGVSQLYTGGSTFSGTATPFNGSTQAVAVRGADIGVNHPLQAVIDLRLQARFQRYFGAGVLFAYSFAGSADSNAVAGAGQFNTQRSINGFRIAALGSGTLPLFEDRVALRLTVALGYRQTSLPLVGFQQVSCGRYGQSRCDPSVVLAQPSLEPRLDALFFLDRARHFLITAGVGAELGGVFGYTASAGVGAVLTGTGRRRRGAPPPPPSVPSGPEPPAPYVAPPFQPERILEDAPGPAPDPPVVVDPAPIG